YGGGRGLEFGRKRGGDLDAGGERADLECDVERQHRADQRFLPGKLGLLEAALGDGEVVRAGGDVEKDVTAGLVSRGSAPAIGGGVGEGDGRVPDRSRLL